jgi:hypothetical protein
MNDEGLELLKEFVESGPPDDPVEFSYCYYCNSDLHDGPHEPDCLRARARAYLRDQGVEIEDDE